MDNAVEGSNASSSCANADGARGIAQIFPPLFWLPRYQLSWLRYDVLAGITLAAYAIPVSLAYATLAGLSPHYGIYCYLVGGLGYAAFGTSRQLAVGPTSAIAMLVGTTVAEMVRQPVGNRKAMTEKLVLGVDGLAK